MNVVLANNTMSWLTPVIIVGVFAIIILIVILVKKHVKAFKSDEKPKSDKEVAAEELDRILQPVEDEKAKSQMADYDSTKGKK